jgi:hypothetical protein
MIVGEQRPIEEDEKEQHNAAERENVVTSIAPQCLQEPDWTNAISAFVLHAYVL